MQKIRVMIVGYGNVGRGVYRSIQNNPDMELAGVVSRSPDRVRRELPGVTVMDVRDVEGWKSALRPDVAILCGGSKDDLPKQGPEFAAHITTVDSFDNHSRIPEYFASMDRVAKEAGHVSVISTGWDPGIFSLERVLGGAFIPGARAYGFYGLGEKGGSAWGTPTRSGRFRGSRMPASTPMRFRRRSNGSGTERIPPSSPATCTPASASWCLRRGPIRKK